jgi:hypothetical protein
MLINTDESYVRKNFKAFQSIAILNARAIAANQSNYYLSVSYNRKNNSLRIYYVFTPQR